MTTPEVRPEAVVQAATWILDTKGRYTREALTERLAGAGYTEAEIAAAHDEAARRMLEPVPTDLRRRAALILVAAYVGTWLVLTLVLIQPTDSGGAGYGTLAAMVLAA